MPQLRPHINVLGPMTVNELIQYLEKCEPEARVKALVGKDNGPIETIEQRKVITPRNPEGLGHTRPPEYLVYLIASGSR